MLLTPCRIEFDFGIAALFRWAAFLWGVCALGLFISQPRARAKNKLSKVGKAAQPQWSTYHGVSCRPPWLHCFTFQPPPLPSVFSIGLKMVLAEYLARSGNGFAASQANARLAAGFVAEPERFTLHLQMLST